MRTFITVAILFDASLAMGEFPVVSQPVPIHTLALKKYRPHCLTFTPDGKTLLFGGGSFGPGWLIFWDVATAKIQHVHQDHKQAVHAIACSPDGKIIATGGCAGEVILWSPEGKVSKKIDGGNECTVSIRFSPDSRIMAHCGGRLLVRETQKFEILAEPDKPDLFGMLGAFSPDGKTLMGSHAQGAMMFMDVSDWKIRTHRTKIANQGYYSPFYTPDGKSVVVGTLFLREEDGKRTPVFSTEVWATTKSGVGQKRFEIPGHHMGMAVSPDSRHLFVGEAEFKNRDRIRVWDMASGKEVLSWRFDPKGGNNIRDLAISPDGKLLASCDDDSLVKVWNLEEILKGR